MEITQELLDELANKLCSLYKVSDFLKFVKCDNNGSFYIENQTCFNKFNNVNFLNTVLPIISNNISNIYSQYNDFFNNDFRFTNLDEILSYLNCICVSLTNIDDIIINKFPQFNDILNNLNTLNNGTNILNNNTGYDLLPLLTEIRDKFVENKIVSIIPVTNYTFDTNNLEGSVLPTGGATIVDGTDPTGIIPVTTPSTQVPLFDYNSLPLSQRQFENGDYNIYRDPLVPYTIDANIVNQPNATGAFATGSDDRVFRFQPPVFYGVDSQEYYQTDFNAEIDWYFDRYYPLTFGNYSLFFGMNGCDQQLTFLLKDGSVTDFNNQTLNINTLKNYVGYCRMGLFVMSSGEAFTGTPNTPYPIL